MAKSLITDNVREFAVASGPIAVSLKKNVIGPPMIAAEQPAVQTVTVPEFSFSNSEVVPQKSFELPVQEVFKPEEYFAPVVEASPKMFAGDAFVKPVLSLPAVEFQPIVEVPSPKFDIGSTEVPQSGGIAGGVLDNSYALNPKNTKGVKIEDMSFLNKLVDKVVGKDKLTGNAQTDSAQILKTANKIISTSKSVTGAIDGGLKALGTFVPGGALAASAFSKLTGGATGPLAAAAAPGKDDGKPLPVWLWPVVIVVGLLILFGKKLFK